MKVSIYTLIDKATGLRFYVGKTTSPLGVRKSDHKTRAKNGSGSAVYQFIRNNKVDFDIVEVDSIECEKWNYAPAYKLEQQWIDFLNGEGYMLLNMKRSKMTEEDSFQDNVYQLQKAI